MGHFFLGKNSYRKGNCVQKDTKNLLTLGEEVCIIIKVRMRTKLRKESR